jgi:multidrug efflux system outer membrane protein
MAMRGSTRWWTRRSPTTPTSRSPPRGYWKLGRSPASPSPTATPSSAPASPPTARAVRWSAPFPCRRACRARRAAISPRWTRATSSICGDACSAAARDGAQLSLTAQVAQQYFALLAADEQEATLRRLFASRGETVALFGRRLDAGLASELELRQAQAEAAFARSQLAGAVQGRERQEAALALLLGRSPRAVLSGRLERGAPRAPDVPVIPDGLPSDLLLRRPDLREAEQRLVAADARLDAARAQYFPAISLTGFLGSESASLGELFSGPAGVFQFAAALTQPIFNAGRLRYETEAARARRGQLEAQYRRAVAAAFADVRDALVAQAAALEALQAETGRTQALREARQMLDLRYEAGIASRLEVLDVERQQLQSDLARIEAERGRRTAIADLFKALGGGWSGAAAAP